MPWCETYVLPCGERARSLCHTLHQSSQQRHAILSSDGVEPIKRQQIKVRSSKEEENDKIIQTMSLTETVTQPIKRPYHLPMPHPWSEKTLPQWAVINAQPLVDKTDQMLLQNDTLKENSFGLSGCCLIADRKSLRMSVEFSFQHTRYWRETLKDSNTKVFFFFLVEPLLVIVNTISPHVT